jgi:hypothetical protein
MRKKTILIICQLFDKNPFSLFLIDDFDRAVDTGIRCTKEELAANVVVLAAVNNVTNVELRGTATSYLTNIADIINKANSNLTVRVL